VNPRYRIYAAAGLAGVVLLGGGVIFLAGSGSPSAAPAPTIKPLHPVGAAAHRASRATVAHHPGARSRVTANPTAPKTRHSSSRIPLAPPRIAKSTQPTDGMPAALSGALKRHTVVVVSLVSPGAAVDEMAYQEAKAGAAQAGAGFVRVNTASNADVQALSTLVDSSSQPGDRLLDDPAVLIFRQPSQLFVRINGYIDAATIAQAALNAAPVSPVRAVPAAGAGAWVTGANAACDDMRAQLAGTAAPTSAADVLPFVQKLVDTIQGAVDRIRALPAPKSQHARVSAMLASYERMLADANAELAAARRGDLSKIQALQSQVRGEGRRGDALAVQLGATSCGAG
jgi:hypothetical protein